MLINLLALDVDDTEHRRDRRSNREKADKDLRVKQAAEGAVRDHEGTGVGDKEEKADEPAVDAVEEDELVADDGEELKDDQDSRRYNGDEVDLDALNEKSEEGPVAR